MRIAILLTLALAAGNAAAQDLGPGDFGYRHHEFHSAYQQIAQAPQPGDNGHRHEEYEDQYHEIFTAGRCHCVSGQCRPTVYRGNPASETGFDVKIDGVWCAVPRGAWLSNEDVPPELFSEPAHVCAGRAATGACPSNIECVIINSSM